ncbi:MAG: dihydropteroate synthase [Bacteroidales bacterium]|nr:dihydropteroate synthase [Bacteroidales bacterium]
MIISNTPQAPFLNVGGQLIDFATPKVMGIMNVTPDSFVPGSRTFDADSIAKRLHEILDQGADIIDIGGYSSRPGADDISPDEEYSRLARGLEIIRREAPEAIISVDTFRASVARKCVEEWGVGIINDISGSDLDPEMAETVADLRVAYILMHMRGTPATMQSLTDYSDVTAEVLEHIARRVDHLHSLGVNDIIIDPGFGFAKTIDQNYRLLDELAIFRTLGLPLLAALSRKSMIWRPLGISPDEAGEGTIVLDTVALLHGADIIRVHDVKAARQTVRLLSLLRENSK